METPAEVGTDDFEIRITDDDFDLANNTPEVSKRDILQGIPSGSSINSGDSEHVDVRVSLSDVVLNQSLQFSAKSIDFEDGDNCSSQEFVENFDSVVVDKNTGRDCSASPSKCQTLPEKEFSDICAEPKDIPSRNSEATESAACLQSQEKASDDYADFEDALDPPLLTSTLKADDKEESDDEFDFDLPSAKVDKKNVRFSGAGDVTDENKVKDEDSKFPSRGGNLVKPSEAAVVTHAAAAAAAAVTSPQANTVADAKPAEVEIVIQSSQPEETKIEQDSEEKEDRSHIITSSAADWDNVETVEAGFSDGPAGDGCELMSSVPPLLSFTDMWQHFRSVDHTAVMDKIQVTVEKHGFSAIVSRLFGPPKLHKTLLEERELVFCIAATAMDNRDEQHVQSLQTVYRVLTGSRFNCQRYGSHWEEIGFQGKDPATDLRGTGMLGLTQLVSFLQDDNTSQLARDIYKLSLHPTQNFPFCLMCINISRICLQSLREGILNRECNRQHKVMAVVNQFYAGALLHLFRLWRQGKTISDSGFVIKDVETRAKKHSKDLFKDLQTYVASQKAKVTGTEAKMAVLDAEQNGTSSFFSVVKSDTKTAAELY